MKNNNSTLITATLLVLAVYNFFYWSAKAFGAFGGFHSAVVAHWKLITFLEFLAIASVTVDIIVRWDKFGPKEKRIRLLITATLGLLFMLKLVFGVIELYMRGGVS